MYNKVTWCDIDTFFYIKLDLTKKKLAGHHVLKNPAEPNDILVFSARVQNV